jgi:hypothetical protein
MPAIEKPIEIWPIAPSPEGDGGVWLRYVTAEGALCGIIAADAVEAWEALLEDQPDIALYAEAEGLTDPPLVKLKETLSYGKKKVVAEVG